MHMQEMLRMLQFLVCVRGGLYKEALKLSKQILLVDPRNATVLEMQAVLAEGATCAVSGERFCGHAVF